MDPHGPTRCLCRRQRRRVGLSGVASDGAELQVEQPRRAGSPGARPRSVVAPHTARVIEHSAEGDADEAPVETPNRSRTTDIRSIELRYQQRIRSVAATGSLSELPGDSVRLFDKIDLPRSEMFGYRARRNWIWITSVRRGATPSSSTNGSSWVSGPNESPARCSIELIDTCAVSCAPNTNSFSLRKSR